MSLPLGFSNLLRVAKYVSQALPLHDIQWVIMLPLYPSLQGMKGKPYVNKCCQRKCKYKISLICPKKKISLEGPREINLSIFYSGVSTAWNSCLQNICIQDQVTTNSCHVDSWLIWIKPSNCIYCIFLIHPKTISVSNPTLSLLSLLRVFTSGPTVHSDVGNDRHSQKCTHSILTCSQDQTTDQW